MSTTSTQHDGGPAFPHNKEFSDGSFSYHPGMSLRDYFAGKALAAIAVDHGPTCDGYREAVSCRAYAIADAMLAERAKGPTP